MSGSTNREQAALWRARLAEQPDLALTREYLDWSADPESRENAERAESAWGALDGIEAAPEMLALRQAALSDARRASGARQRWTVPRRMAAALAAAVVLAGGAGVAVQPFLPTVYKTGVGERRVVVLQDGTRLSLDAASEVRIRYSGKARTLTLARGQARFDVAGDVARPFLVQAAGRTISTSEGAFNVDLIGEALCVTPLKGRVLVMADLGPTHQVSAGQQLLRGAVRQADTAEAVAWERGELVFENVTLAEAVQRVSRYSARPIEVHPAAASLRVSGAFDAGDTESFVDGMTSYFGLAAAPGEDGAVVLRRR